RLLEEDGGRWTLHDEFKAAVRIDRNDHRDRDAAHLLGAVIELSDKGPDVDAVLTQCRPNRRRRSGLAAGHLQSNMCGYVPRHRFIASPTFRRLKPAAPPFNTV